MEARGAGIAEGLCEQIWVLEQKMPQALRAYGIAHRMGQMFRGLLTTIITPPGRGELVDLFQAAGSVLSFAMNCKNKPCVYS